MGLQIGLGPGGPKGREGILRGVVERQASGLAQHGTGGSEIAGLRRTPAPQWPTELARACLC
jgi:hypothetical protein